VPVALFSSLKSWDFWAIVLYLTFVVLAVAGTICSIIVALFVDKLSATKTRVLAAIAAASLGLIAAFNLGDRSISYGGRGAISMLQSSCIPTIPITRSLS
jgi:heme exporter protein D